MGGKITIVCKECGSENVSKDACARWSIKDQEWQLSAVYDKPNFCDDCEGETTLVEKQITDNG